MQDPTAFAQLKPRFPEQEQLKCPRCESTNTKFCYYNNYNLSQPRHFCKSCRRYWTKGGALRNIPVGGVSRKNAKRSSNSKRTAANSSSSAPNLSTQNTNPNLESISVPGSDLNPIRNHRDIKMPDISGCFSSLLASDGQLGNFPDSLNPIGSVVENLNLVSDPDSGSLQNRSLELQGNNNSSDGFLGRLQKGDSSCWGNGNGWPDLAIFTPGSNFH
ncbi:hypothetical protein Nepgr_019453 [Nepenthes gracilis]|uniref:Dof zinc finger protein n=1 Tax=Nepenthes gracilis TaxID=150966 RepID=A0AAD3SVZ2_NEPGR|nr:hypothetical protein Nepgr_019453 [Nepenthes gracilis]